VSYIEFCCLLDVKLDCGCHDQYSELYRPVVGQHNNSRRGNGINCWHALQLGHLKVTYDYALSRACHGDIGGHSNAAGQQELEAGLM
jgi:hypothetical protein